MRQDNFRPSGQAQGLFAPQRQDCNPELFRQGQREDHVPAAYAAEKPAPKRRGLWIWLILPVMALMIAGLILAALGPLTESPAAASTPEATQTVASKPKSMPKSTAAPKPASTSKPAPSPSPSAVPKAAATSKPTATTSTKVATAASKPAATGKAPATPNATSTPKATPTPVVTPTPKPTATPDPAAELPDGAESVTTVNEPEIHTHSFVFTETRAATCTTQGVMIGTCSCGETTTKTVPALGHRFQQCGQDGDVLIYQCLQCGATYRELKGD